MQDWNNFVNWGASVVDGAIDWVRQHLGTILTGIAVLATAARLYGLVGVVAGIAAAGGLATVTALTVATATKICTVVITASLISTLALQFKGIINYLIQLGVGVLLNVINIVNAYNQHKISQGSYTPKVNYNGKQSEIYCDGNDLAVKPNEIKIDPETELVKPTHGISVNVDLNAVSKFGGAYKVEYLPEGLSIIQRGSNLTHFEIVLSYSMTVEQFQALLNMIRLVP